MSISDTKDEPLSGGAVGEEGQKHSMTLIKYEQQDTNNKL